MRVSAPRTPAPALDTPEKAAPVARTPAPPSTRQRSTDNQPGHPAPNRQHHPNNRRPEIRIAENLCLISRRTETSPIRTTTSR
jgi:hypothetical protein